MGKFCYNVGVKPKFKIGDYVHTTGAISAKGRIISIKKGGKSIGFPWDDDTPHYELIDEVTGVAIISHPNSLTSIP